MDVIKDQEVRITVDPEIRGRPVVRGTRVDVSTVLHQLANGLDVDEIEREYGISKADVRAVLRYAAEALDKKRFRAG